MPKYYASLWTHLVWATKYRQPIIKSTSKFKLFNQFREIADNKGYHLDFINGMTDHVHLLISTKPTQNISDVVRNFKGISHAWARKEGIFDEYLHWQDGYAAISVSPHQVDVVRNYIRNQESHHLEISFKDEWAKFRKADLLNP